MRNRSVRVLPSGQDAVSEGKWVFDPLLENIIMDYSDGKGLIDCSGIETLLRDHSVYIESPRP